MQQVLCQNSYFSVSYFVSKPKSLRALYALFSFSFKSTTLEVRTLPPKTVSSLQIETAAVTRVTKLEVNSEHSSTKSPSMPLVQAASPGQAPSHLAPTIKKVSNLERIAAQLQANKLPKSSEIKTEAITTSGLTTTNSLSRRNSDAGQPNAKSVNTYTINKTVVSPVDVVTSQVTPVTTIASTTTAQESILGKRIRRQSSKYEDYEQHSITVRKLSLTL